MDRFRDAIVSVVMLAAVIGGVVWAMGIPTVYSSHATGECVRVVPHGTCDDLPDRYDHRWVR